MNLRHSSNTQRLDQRRPNASLVSSGRPFNLAPEPYNSSQQQPRPRSTQCLELSQRPLRKLLSPSSLRTWTLSYRGGSKPCRLLLSSELQRSKGSQSWCPCLNSRLKTHNKDKNKMKVHSRNEHKMKAHRVNRARGQAGKWR